MKTFGVISLAALASSVLAAPAPTTTITATGIPSAMPHLEPLGIEIHGSCNITERRQLTAALSELTELASTAQSHLLRTGTSSLIFRKWFGANAPTAEVLGWFTRILSANKPGHWRGSNATSETVICPLSHTSRRPLTQMCALGYNVANYKTNLFFASDLLHRVFHIPVLAEGVIDHYSDSWEDALELAQNGNESLSVRNSDSLQWFALEVYAYEVGNPGIGCAGVRDASSSTSAAASAATSAATSATISVDTPAGTSADTSAATSAAVSADTSVATSAAITTSAAPTTLITSSTHPPTTTTSQPPTTTSPASLHCHTHSDGVVHCD